MRGLHRGRDTMSNGSKFVVVGAGLAGAKAVETLRDEGFEGAIDLVGDEREYPYERPPLSKDYLLGKQPREGALVHDGDWYAKHDVTLHLGTRATRLDLSDHRIELKGGASLDFDKLLLATGSSPRKLRIPGNELDGVFYLRRIEHTDALISALSGGGQKVVFIGGGWIGLEVASAARTYQNEVTIIEPQNTLLEGPLGPELGGMFPDLHREHGVRLLLGDSVEEIKGTDGKVSAVVTKSGETVAADVVVVGIGARPNVELAEDAKLDVDNGVLVDAALQTSHPDVYAAGDIANVFNPLFGRRIRVEHWANALNSGPLAARSMLGQSVSYDRVPYFFTDQYDLGMEYSGDIGPDGYDNVVYRGDPSTREFIAFWTKDGRVLAGMNVNVWDVTDDVQALIKSKKPIDAARLADKNVPLSDLVN